MTKSTIGILGDGQLARMLAQAAPKAEVDTVVFASSEKNPAALTGVPVVTGRSDRMEDLQKFLLRAKLIVFENEFLDCALLARSSQATGAFFVPSLDNLFLFQDKLRQKTKLNELGIPTSPHLAWDGQDAIAYIGKAFDQFKACAFKWSRLGYDGKGVFLARDRAQDLTALLDFFAQAKKAGVEVFAEELISFRRELAIVACHSTKGEFASYPLVISRQENGICRQVLGPATEFGVDPKLEYQARESARALAESCKLHGCFAIEFFETEKGELLVNEIAPRVHNTGHYTMDAAFTSQFENHLRAVTGKKLGPTGTSPAFFMLNILGPDGIERLKDTPERRPKAPRLSALHWYEKEEIRPRRKLGHINVAAPTPEELQERMNEILRADREWALSLKPL
ncbi:MAG: 5-(carboxyamino)imidazole ribonucleotide synthase [Bdellovibrionia bacterium]